MADLPDTPPPTAQLPQPPPQDQPPPDQGQDQDQGQPATSEIPPPLQQIFGGFSPLAQLAQSAGLPMQGRTRPDVVPFRPPGPIMRPIPRPWHMGPAPARHSPPGTPLLSPTGLPPRFRTFTPFMRALPIRMPNMWGVAPQYPALPAGFEVPGILQAASQFFAGNGSGVTAPMGGMLGGAVNTHSKAFMQGQEDALKLQREKMLQQADQLTLQQKQEADDYAEVFNTYAANDYKPLNGVTIDQALSEVAAKYNDKNMQSSLASGGAKSAYKLMQLRDSHWQDINAAKKTSARDTAQTGTPEERATMGLPPVPVGQDESTPAPPPDQDGGIQKTETGHVRAADETTDPDKADTVNAHHDADIRNDIAEHRDTPASAWTKSDGTLLPYQQIGLDMARGASSDGTLPAFAKVPAAQYASSVQSRLDKIVADATREDNPISADEIAKRVRAVSPAIAADLDDMRTGAIGVPGGMNAIGSHPYWRDLVSLLRKEDPNWTAADFHTIQTTMDDYAKGNASRRMFAGSRMAQAGAVLLKAIKEVPEGSIPPANWIELGLSKNLTGNPEWLKIFNAYQTYVQESQSLASPTGRYFEGDVDRLMRNNPATSGTRALRGIIQQDAENAVGLMDTMDRTYKSVTGKQRDAPYYDAQNMKVLKALTKLDEEKGFSGVKDLPDELQGLGLGAAAPAAPADATTPAPDSGWSLSPP